MRLNFTHSGFELPERLADAGCREIPVKRTPDMRDQGLMKVYAAKLVDQTSRGISSIANPASEASLPQGFSSSKCVLGDSQSDLMMKTYGLTQL